MISVIVTAYNRKDYIDSAIASLEKQTFKDFEVIVITNFDYDITGFKSIKYIKHIKMDGGLGLFIYTGIKNSSGEILVFLDDDDTFAENKIEYVNNLFLNSKIVYLHNSPVYVEETKKYRKIFTPPDFNLSCISLRKDAVMNYIEYLKNLGAGPDTFMYCSALCSGNTLLKKRNYLTFYRHHVGSTSDIKASMKWLIDDLNVSKYMQSVFNCKKSKKYLSRIEYSNKIKLYIFYKYEIKKDELKGKRFMVFELWLYFMYNYKFSDLYIVIKKFFSFIPILI